MDQIGIRKVLNESKWAILTVLVMLTALSMLLPARPGVTRINVARLKQGMSMKQVEALFGAAGEDPEGRPLTIRFMNSQRCWKSNDLEVVVAISINTHEVMNWGIIDNNGKATAANPEWRRPTFLETWFDAVRSWIGW